MSEARAWPAKRGGVKSTHGRRRNFSRGVKKIFLGGGLQKKTQGGGLLSILRVWVGRGIREKFSCATAIFEQKFFEKRKLFKNLAFFSYFYGSERGKPWKMSFFLYWGVNFCLREGD